MFKYAAACLAIACGAGAAQGSLIISLGDHPLLPNTAGQPVQIFVTGDTAVNGVQVECEVDDGGPTAGGKDPPGPMITSLDVITGTIFAGNNTGQTGTPTGVILPQIASRGTTTSSGTVVASGLLATIMFDTSTFNTIGQSWPLHFSSPEGSTVFGEDIPVIYVGSIYIAPSGSVPEPATFPLLAAGCALMLRRRARRAPA